MKYKKLTGIGFCCAVMLMAGATTVFATNDKPVAAEDSVAAAEEERLDIAYTNTAAKSADVTSDASADESGGEQEEIKSVEYVIAADDVEEVEMRFRKNAEQTAEQSDKYADEVKLYEYKETVEQTEEAAKEAMLEAAGSTNTEVVSDSKSSNVMISDDAEVYYKITDADGNTITESESLLKVNGSEYVITWDDPETGEALNAAIQEEKN